MNATEFHDSCVPVPESGCWLWTRAFTRRASVSYGYAGVPQAGSEVMAHRIAWVLANGPIPAGMQVCHRCDVGLCVNPAHLFLGTQQQNMDDKMRKGRHNPPRGERCAQHKLKTAQVLAILASADDNQTLAKRYGVRTQTISKIKCGRRWRHLRAAA